MSGYLALTFRWADGSTDILATWNRHVVPTVWHAGILDGDEGPARDYVAWWKANCTKEFRKESRLAPCTDYGLFVVDFRDKVMHALNPGFDLFDNLFDGAVRDDLALACAERGQAVIEGRLKADYHQEAETPLTPEIIHAVRREIAAGEEFAHIRRAVNGVVPSMVRLDLAPWKVVEYPETIAGAETMRNALRDAGFDVDSRRATKGWQEWCAFAAEFDVEDDEEMETPSP